MVRQPDQTCRRFAQSPLLSPSFRSLFPVEFPPRMIWTRLLRSIYRISPDLLWDDDYGQKTGSSFSRQRCAVFNLKVHWRYQDVRSDVLFHFEIKIYFLKSATPKSLQIFLHKRLCISVCRGTVDTLLRFGLKKT